MRLWPRSLAGQLIAALLLALLVAQVVSVMIFMGERRDALLGVHRDEVLARAATLVRLMQVTPSEQHQTIVETATTRHVRFWLDGTAAVPPGEPGRVNRRLAERLREHLMHDTPVEDVRVDLRHVEHREKRFERDEEDHAHDHPPPHRDTMRRRHWRKPVSLTLAIGLEDGRWFNAHVRVPPPRPGWAAQSMLALAASAIAVCVIVVLVVRRTTRPMRSLASAAEAFGRGAPAAPLPETGSREVRRTMVAFNEMQERIKRFVDDRMRMLAAISHDLRTPLTSLRLRAELVDHEEIREKMLATLDELERMVEATLAFAREEAAEEETRPIDLTALIDSIVTDLADGGHAVSFEDAERFSLACRPAGRKRALRNLIENAVRYGERATVRLEVTSDGVVILIEDEGPGIPEADLSRVFEPFVRLEESRSRETGGVGLGLAIARTIVRDHGGDVTLENRAEGGLRVRVWLPVKGA